jgi:hypothetical protein
MNATAEAYRLWVIAALLLVVAGLGGAAWVAAAAWSTRFRATPRQQAAARNARLPRGACCSQCHRGGEFLVLTWIRDDLVPICVTCLFRVQAVTR